MPARGAALVEPLVEDAATSKVPYIVRGFSFVLFVGLATVMLLRLAPRLGESGLPFKRHGSSIAMAIRMAPAPSLQCRWDRYFFGGPISRHYDSSRKACATASIHDFSDIQGVVVFSREGCPYCVRVKGLLRRNSVRFEVVDVAVEPQRRNEAVERSGARTIPQVFVGSELLGGFDNVSRLVESGKLFEILEHHKASGCPEVITPTPAEAFSAANPLTVDALQLLGKAGRAIASRELLPGKPPSLARFLIYAVNRKPLPYDPSLMCLNDVGSVPAEEASVELPVEKILAALRTMMLRLTDCFVDAEGNVDYVKLKTSDAWFEFLALAAELGRTRADEIQNILASFGENDKKAFLINLYNVMIFHGVTQYGRRPGSWFLYTFFITPLVSYRVGRARLSLDEVENGLLRLRPGYFEDPAQAACIPLKVQKVDARIHMALNCGAKGCPAIAVYSGATLDAELDDATAAFLASDANLLLEPDGSPPRVGFSMIFQMYLVDFLGDPVPKLGSQDRTIAQGLLRWSLPYTSGTKRAAVEALLRTLEEDGETVELVWLPYDWTTNGADVALDWRVYLPRLLVRN